MSEATIIPVGGAYTPPNVRIEQDAQNLACGIAVLLFIWFGLLLWGTCAYPIDSSTAVVGVTAQFVTIAVGLVLCAVMIGSDGRNNMFGIVGCFFVLCGAYCLVAIVFFWLVALQESERAKLIMPMAVTFWMMGPLLTLVLVIVVICVLRHFCRHCCE